MGGRGGVVWSVRADVMAGKGPKRLRTSEGGGTLPVIMSIIGPREAHDYLYS